MAKVIFKFECRLTGKVYNVGDDYTGSDERITELVSKGKVEAVKEKKEIAPAKEKVEVEKPSKKKK